MNDNVIPELFNILPDIACIILIMGFVKLIHDNNIKFQIIELSPDEYKITDNGEEYVRTDKLYLLG